MKILFNRLFLGAWMVGLVITGQTTAQSAMTLGTVGNGERVKLAAGGKSKIVNLERDFGGDFTAGGDAPHRYATLLSIRKGDSFYLVAKFTSGAAISDKNAPCGGDAPQTLLLIEANKNLTVQKVQTEVFNSCIYNGSGRYIKGKPQITKSKISIAFDEGKKKYVLKFDANEAEKNLQLTAR